MTIQRLIFLSLTALLGLNACVFQQSKNEATAEVDTIQAPTIVAAPVMAPPASEESPAVTYRDPDPIALNANHPGEYVVVKGDTLWDISAMFLEDAWLWPEIWYVNPQIENPHLIYPGDLLTLVYVDGRPRLEVTRAANVSGNNRNTGGRERLSPRIREKPLSDAITTIPYEKIAGFLSKPTVLDKKQIARAPYILGTREGNLIAGEGFSTYIRGTDAPVGTRFNIFNIGDVYRDPETNKVLGYAATFVGEGRVERSGDPSTMYILDSKREVLEGDRLLRQDQDIPLQFFPRSPEAPIEGQIMAITNGISRVGQYQIVVLNRGLKHGLDQGHVLDIWQAGEKISDDFARKAKGDAKGKVRVRLPDEKAGTLMVFRSLENLSYALIMDADRSISPEDIVRNPN